MSVARYEAYFRLYAVLFFVLFLGFFIAMMVFGEAYRFWQYPYSDLGATETANGYPNRVSVIVFVTDMFCIGIILAVISVVSSRDRLLPHRGVRSVFAASGAFGAFVATFPHNLYPIQHTLGSAFLVGSLWVLSVFAIVDVGTLVSGIAARWLHAVLHITVISYAINYVLDTLIKQVFQKFAVFGLCAVLLSAFRMLARTARRDAEANRATSSTPCEATEDSSGVSPEAG